MFCYSGAAYGLVVEAPKCCSSLTAIDTLLGMMQEYKDEMKTLKVQVQSGGQNHGMATLSIMCNNYRVWMFTLKKVIWLDVMGHMTLKTRR